ncbi:hypothetical protein [Agrococcus sp. ARC_14]|uniref:hypothetical protein n=1 Tax=Agrococcus sp. ARC_14 TaxID=2919927 RepID=UPI001F059FF6|nr:hypothetical protein [Agrococcus sp. ARC_14]MCH1883879.1 hypothetical protein [Agrococcus sp. ARC_14]
MTRTTWIGAVAVAAMLLTGCASAAEPAAPAPEPSHTMPDGTVMSGAEHEGHEGDDAHASHQSDVEEPSDAARMICAGQVVTAVTATLRLDEEIVPSSTWDAPMFTCTYDVDGAPLVLSVHDTTDPAAGEEHYAALQSSVGAHDIDGLLGLGLPSFSNDEGIVSFLRDGKTLVVDATALPEGFAGDMTQDQAAYAIATAVLGCWVEHD